MKRDKIITLAALLFVAPAMSFGTIVVNDDFSDLDRTQTGLLDADWWSSSSTSGNSIEIDGTGLGLVTGTSGRGIHATFAPQTLAIGETITATVDFTTPATVGANKSTGFKFAMMSFNDPGLAADLLSSSTVGSENPLYVGLPGYASDFDVNKTDATDDVTIRIHDTTSTLGRFLGTTSEWIDSGSSADAGYDFVGNTAYVATFSVERTGDGVTVSSSISNGGGLMDSHSRDYAEGDYAVATDLGMFGIWANSDTFGSTNSSDPDNGITLTNFQVEVIPEPATISLIGLAGGALLFLRRRYTI